MKINYILILVSSIIFISCNSNVDYEYGKLKTNKECFYESKSNKIRIIDSNHLINHDTIKFINKIDTVLFFNSNYYCDTNYLYVTIHGISSKKDQEPIKVSINENEIISNFIFPSHHSIFISLKIKKVNDFFIISGLNDNMIYKIEIDKNYHRAHIFQLNDQKKILCKYTDEDMYIR